MFKKRIILSLLFLCIYLGSDKLAVDGFEENHQGPIIYHHPGVIPVFNGDSNVQNPVVPTQGYNTYPNPNGPIIQRIPSVGSGPQYGDVTNNNHNHNHQYDNYGNHNHNDMNNNNGYNNGQAQYDQFGRPIPPKLRYSQNVTYPRECVGEYRNSKQCLLMVTIIRNNNKPDWVTFELRGKSTGYVAVGLSDDLKMGEDHIIECIQRKYNQFDHYQSFSKGHLPPERIVDKPEIVNNFNYKLDNGYFICTFDRFVKTEIFFNDKKYIYDLKKGDHHILLAMGSMKGVAEKDEIGYHGKEKRYAEPSPIRDPYYRRNASSRKELSFFQFLNSLFILWLGIRITDIM